jgi:hypothetical protein
VLKPDFWTNDQILLDILHYLCEVPANRLAPYDCSLINAGHYAYSPRNTSARVSFLINLYYQLHVNDDSGPCEFRSWLNGT